MKNIEILRVRGSIKAINDEIIKICRIIKTNFDHGNIFEVGEPHQFDYSKLINSIYESKECFYYLDDLIDANADLRSELIKLEGEN